jgi:hypothetical protein
MTEDDTKERDEVARKNKQALIYLLAEHPEIFIGTRDFANWRPTVREIGTIPGVWESVEILCTDGLIAWFLNHDPDRFGEVLVGHIQHFSGEVARFTLASLTSRSKNGRTSRGRKGRVYFLGHLLFFHVMFAEMNKTTRTQRYERKQLWVLMQECFI